MTELNRRMLIGGLLGVMVGSGATLIPSAEAMPFGAAGPDLSDPLIQEAQWNTRPPGWAHRPPPSRWRHHRRPQRRRVCWWHRGRRVCGWRWV
jgi:hypothetical protein